MVVLAGPAGSPASAGPAQPSVSTAVDDHHHDTTSRLELSDPTTSEYATASPDLGSTLAAKDAAIRDDAAAHAVAHELRNVPVDERADVLDEAIERTKGDVDRLEERQATLIEAYRAGEVSDRQFLRELVLLERDAASLADVFREYDALADDVPGYTFAEGEDLRTLESYRGPAVGLLADHVRGRASARQVALVTTADGGAVMSTVDGDRYLREAIAFEHRDRPAPAVLTSFGAVEQAASERYPWLDDEADNIFNLEAYDLYRYEIGHEQGHLLTYWDKGSGDVYREIQRLSVSRLPTSELDETWEAESLRVSIVETPHDGPIEVAVTDAATGDPVDAELRLDGVALGTTGDDGRAWVLPPPGGYELTAHADGATVTADVGP